MMIRRPYRTAPCEAGPGEGAEIGAPSFEPSVDVDKCASPECRHKQRLRETLVETIEALEKTRATFKSKLIEALRKKLFAVLTEEL